MVQISEVNIISIDKNEETWGIEGEILFEGDLTTAFSVTYNVDYDELEDLEIEVNPGRYDSNELKNKILDAASACEE